MAFSVKILLLAGISGLLTASGAAGQENASENNPWYTAGQEALAERLAHRPNTNRAKNVIVFWADGLDVTLTTVARIFAGQLQGGSGEGHRLAHEYFPYSALVKTYTANSQIGDSAATASAFMTGVKTHDGAVSVYGGTESCTDMQENGVPVSLGELAAQAGKATGVITTTFVVDASPASTYAHAPDRGWVLDTRLSEADIEAGCEDIVSQLIDSHIDVAMGGGRLAFINNDITDPENTERTGLREDGRNLITEWTESRDGASYISSASELAALDTGSVDRLLGLFSPLALEDSVARAESGGDDPTLPQMTRTALEILTRDEDGFFLFVETEESDDLQHGGMAQMGARALIELEQAVETALSMVNTDETLIILTGDHGHSLTFSGYSPLGNPVFGLVGGQGEDATIFEDGKPRTSVGYRDGPGGITGERPNPAELDTQDPHFIAPAMVPARGESHGGQDVPLYATGPWAHLFSGTLEQNAFFHLIRHAMEGGE